ncbi:glycosyltransferase family 4 protein [Sphingobacterium spiritivorum]|uniref:glycosyltransferase family 4 protein n=1 Tax=Sphingobacterium spiritivorum TaxID=258 RepID=UPI003DA490F4
MKIVYNIRGTFNSGGMERVLANKANYLARMGYDITIITTDQQEQNSYFNMDSRIAHVDLGINYSDHDSSNLLNKICSYITKQKKHRRKLTEVLTLLKADIVISMFDHDGSFLYKINDGSKKILEIHFSRYKRIQYGRKGIWKYVDLLRSHSDADTASRYDSFVVLTEEDRGYWGDMANIRVIPNANSFTPDTQAALDAKVAVAVGRYDYQKGFDNLIRIWYEIHKTHPDWSLNIFGQGPLKENLQHLISELKLSEVVHLCSPVKNIEQEYLRSSILVMTSRYEGFGMALSEAQACGLPLVAYACKCGPKDIIRTGSNGYLIAENDVKDFVEKVNLLIENKTLRTEIGANAIAMSQHYSEEKVMNQWVSLFDGLMNNRKGIAIPLNN